MPVEEWATIVSPWTRDVAKHGFSFLDRAEHNYSDSLLGFADYYFDGSGTFLDFNGVIELGPHEGGVLPGFNGVQLYTFVSGRNLVLTNGSPPNAPMPPRIFDWLLAKVPDRVKGIRMKTPDDLAHVIHEHRQAVAQERGEVLKTDRARPLQWRWDMMKELDA